MELATRGLNLILIARDQSKLEATANEIRFNAGVKVEVLSVDFNSPSQFMVYQLIREKLQGKEIGVLVNNVGIMPSRPKLFCEFKEEELWPLINVNMASVLLMTYTILPAMVSRRKGVVVNVSSISAMYPLPLMSPYSASKVFVDWFTRALNYEYKDKGIIIQSVIPSYVVTRLTQFSRFLQRPNLVVPDAGRFAANAVATIGYTDRTTGFWSHGLQYWFYSLIPESWWFFGSWHLLRGLDTERGRDKNSPSSARPKLL
jgi:short-subunit dehydrogenase